MDILTMKTSSLIPGLTVAFAFTAPSFAQIIFQNNFDDDPIGVYTDNNLEADWPGVPSETGVDEGRVAIVGGADAYSGRSMEITYPAGESNDGKSQWRMPLDQGYEELYLSYRMRFGAGFDFVRGGKLPGLAGGAGNTGGDKPTGTDGFSARMMWRTDGSGGSPTNRDTANAVQYVYHPDQPTDNGEDFRWDDNAAGDWAVFESDTWYHFQHRVVMNTPGQHDGIVQAWLDDELVLDVQDLRFRDVASLQIDELLFSTFFGGSSAIWETTKTEHTYFDDFVISTDFIVDAGPGDFNADGHVDVQDIDALIALVGTSAPPSDAAFDLNEDGLINRFDLNLLVETLVETPLGIGTSLGDANLDGVVGLLDLDVLGAAFNGPGSWANGDFNANGQIDLLDLDLMGANWGDTASLTQAMQALGLSIPEPSTLGTLSAALLIGRRRQNRQSK